MHQRESATLDTSQSVADNVADVTMIAKYIFSGGTLTHFPSADVNGDGVVGTDDVDEVVGLIVT